MKICIVLGTRPEIIKMSPIIRECQKRNLDFFILHTSQHYSDNLDSMFFDELSLPQPKYRLNIGRVSRYKNNHAEQTGKILIHIERKLIKEKPDIVLVEGDTNTGLAAALAATKLNIKIGHIEAGLRSYFRGMPEEINRILIDHCSDLLFTPTEESKKILLKEGIDKDKIFVTGNTIVDAVSQNLKLSKCSSILEKHNLSKQKYFLATLHRSENVDHKERFKNILSGFELIHQKFGLPIIWPIHPRAQKLINKFKLEIPKGVKTIDAIGFLDFLHFQNNAKLILTDSGGVQEESCILKVPCVTLRDNTERPETVKVGSNIIAGTNPQKIMKSISIMLNRNKNWKNPFGSGDAGKKIINIILK